MASETLVPDGLLLSTNLTGGLSAIDTDDTTFLVATANNQDSIVAVSFSTPTGDPDTGVDVQNFTLKYRVTPNASTVTFNAFLRENGTRINGGTAIDTWTSSSTSEVTREIPWNASLLGTADGSLVELEVVATAVGGAPGGRTTGEFQFIDWDVEFTAGDDDLIADDVESASETGNPALGQEHVLLADDSDSTSETDTPALGQEHALLADDSDSASETGTPVLALIYNPIADDSESNSETDQPALGQEHSLLADDAESASETESPALGQGHILIADSVESNSELGTPALAEEGDGAAFYFFQRQIAEINARQNSSLGR